MFRNYTHGDMDTFIAQGMVQASSLLQAAFLWGALLFGIVISCFFPFFGVVGGVLFVAFLLLYRKPAQVDFWFTFRFNVLKFLGVMVGAVQGIPSGYALRRFLLKNPGVTL